jgi:hypothetical protein
VVGASIGAVLGIVLLILLCILFIVGRMKRAQNDDGCLEIDRETELDFEPEDSTVNGLYDDDDPFCVSEHPGDSDAYFADAGFLPYDETLFE